MVGHVKGARGDEQYMIRLDGAILGPDRGTLDQRQKIALHAFAADVRAANALRTSADFVDFVQEHDPVILDGFDRFLHDLLIIEQLVGIHRRSRLRRNP